MIPGFTASGTVAGGSPTFQAEPRSRPPRGLVPVVLGGLGDETMQSPEGGRRSLAPHYWCACPCCMTYSCGWLGLSTCTSCC